ncbi:VPLPA-CTERM sorting domain-containing protein [Rubellimicrobium arenae]|nr:VPLPA-CTERM sorting domain-containing protein [Rubellimicrobium arenae]
MPLAAKAVTLGATNTIRSGQSVTLLEGKAWNFVATFSPADADNRSGTYSFVFRNASDTRKTLSFGATVNQVAARFAGGVKIKLGGYLLDTTKHPDWTTSQGTDLTLAARESQTLTISFGRVRAVQPSGQATITFAASVVPAPLPATGGLLLSAIAGCGLLRRRSRSAGPPPNLALS